MGGMLDYQNTTYDIEAGNPHTAILPIAVVERHGSHLPVGADWMIVDAIASRVAETMGEGCYLLPTMPYGTSAGHVGEAGTLSLAPLTLMHVVRDLVDGLIAQGIRRVAVINSHGGAGESTVRPQGNFIVKTAVRQLNYDYPDLKAIWVQPFTVANGLFARLVAHVYEYQQGYRSLPFTPLTRSQSSEWAVPPPDVGEHRFDATAFVIRRLQLFLNAYAEAERELDRASRRYRALRTRFRDLDINQRQARILDKALSAPSTVFTLRRHARSRGLAYETARQDFVQLANLGYLEQSKRGRVFEFRLAKNADKRLLALLAT